MAIGLTNGSNAPSGGPLTYDLTPQTYTSLGTLVTATKDDVRDLYVATFGDQGITGLLDFTGAKKSAGTADEVSWFEEGRLHRTVTMNASGNVTHVDGAAFTAETNAVRKYDVLLGLGSTDKGQRLIVTDVSSTVVTAKDMTDGGSHTFAAEDYAIIGNAYPQGSDQPTQPFAPKLTRRNNPFIIVKETFHVTGSQASNVGWVNVNGQNMWYLKGELDARRKFMNMREAMLVFGEKNYTGSAYTGDVIGSEGYFAAVEDRGIVATNTFFDSSLNTFGATNGFDDVILEMDQQGSPSENAMYLNRQESINVDDIIATAGLGGTNVGAASAYGAFGNSEDMAIQLGFKSFTRGGYTFHKHDWKILNDPTVGADSGYKGAIIPLGTVVDPKTGNSNPSLEMNYKAAGNYSREMEHWVEGGGVLGYNTGSEDLAKFHYRSECNLCVRAANQHVVLK